jgi:hypothetical protein
MPISLTTTLKVNLFRLAKVEIHIVGMTWIPTKLTREQMEERRLERGQLLKEGKLSNAEIARQQ